MVILVDNKSLSTGVEQTYPRRIIPCDNT